MTREIIASREHAGFARAAFARVLGQLKTNLPPGTHYDVALVEKFIAAAYEALPTNESCRRAARRRKALSRKE